MNPVIRPYRLTDRSAVRQIAFETAFMGASAAVFFEGQEFLKDALTLYFTDHEPESIWVFEVDGVVAGYILGARDEKKMDRVVWTKIIPGLCVDALGQGLLLRPRNMKLLGGLAASFLKGEFFMPSFSEDYPAVLHINLKADRRGHGAGGALIRTLVEAFTQAGVKGVHLGTMSSAGADFFQKNGFVLLFQGQRSYMENFAGKAVPLYLLGRKLR